VPVAVIGSEEVHPILFERASAPPGSCADPGDSDVPPLGPLGVIPLPSRWRIRFGEPIWFDDVSAERAVDPLYVNRTRGACAGDPEPARTRSCRGAGRCSPERRGCPA